MSDEKIIVIVDEDLEDLIPGFLENRANDLGKLRDQLEQGAFDEIKATGHSLKGVGGGYGFDRITELGAALEQAGLASNRDEITRLLDDLEEFLSRVEIKYE